MIYISTILQQSLLSIISIFKVLFLSKYSKISKSENKKVVVLANGPSLNKCINDEENIEKLKEVDLICVNYFSNSPKFKELKPEYYILSAPEFWIDKVEDMYVQNRQKMFATLADVVDWPMELYIPVESKKFSFWKKILIQNKNIKVVYYNQNTIEGLKRISFFIYNRKLGMPKSHNILGNSIMMMIWKGYKEIGLLGVDHSWLPTIYVDSNNTPLLVQKHFYEKGKVKGDIMRKTGVGQRKLHEIIFKFYLSFKAYFEIKEYADKQGVSIKNLTEDSFIDAFDRSDLKMFLN